jgi:hypothetical protein
VCGRRCEFHGGRTRNGVSTNLLGKGCGRRERCRLHRDESIYMHGQCPCATRCFIDGTRPVSGTPRVLRGRAAGELPIQPWRWQILAGCRRASPTDRSSADLGTSQDPRGSNMRTVDRWEEVGRSATLPRPGQPTSWPPAVSSTPWARSSPRRADDSGVNDRHVRNWTRGDVAAVVELHAALGEVIRTRRSYDSIRRNRWPNSTCRRAA